MSARPLLTSHAVPGRSTCEAVACRRRVTLVSVHILTPRNGDGRQGIVVGQLCDVHAAELQDDLRALADVRPPLDVWQGGRDG